MTTTERRFWSKVDQAGDCWTWIAGQSNGYGSFKVSGKSVPAHRVAYEMTCGTVPDGLVLDHLCRNTLCVNPSHLEAVTRGENTRRGLKTYALRNTCKRGHDITDPTNLKTRANGSSECRVCARASYLTTPSALRRSNRKAA